MSLAKHSAWKRLGLLKIPPAFLSAAVLGFDASRSHLGDYVEVTNQV